MIDQAAERIVDLNERGYSNAGLYNPAGVGGTHVMYVLKDAKNPQNVDLPVDPSISPLVSLWKGITKPLATFALGAVALGAFVHYVAVGPKDEPVDEDDMDPREDDPDKLRGPHEERRDADIREVRRGA
jgi:formate dehydrogenase iron-sulfur subunit